MSPPKPLKAKTTVAAAAPPKAPKKGAGSSVTNVTADATISFGPNAVQSVVSAKSKKIIIEVMRAAGVKSLTITSTFRTAKDQARAMYDNLSAPGGVAKAKGLYKAAGQKIIVVYEQLKNEGKSAEQIKAGMEKKINELGAGVVSKHSKDPSKTNVIDIAPSSILPSKRAMFVSKMRDAKVQGKVSVFLEPGQGDPAYHIEIVQ